MATKQPIKDQEVVCCDYKIKWTSQHQSAEELRGLTYTYDEVATQALDELYKIGSPAEEKYGLDYYKLLKTNATNGGKIEELWNQVNTVPSWVDWDQIERGQKVYFRYAGPASTAVSLNLIRAESWLGQLVNIADCK
jgi:hypothetical protein